MCEMGWAAVMDESVIGSARCSKGEGKRRSQVSRCSSSGRQARHGRLHGVKKCDQLTMGPGMVATGFRYVEVCVW